MNPEFLDFEQPIAELQAKIDELSNVGAQSDLNVADEVSTLTSKRDALIGRIFSELTPWQIAQMARHPSRPYALDYVDGLLDEFDELHGDRAYADDPALVGGVGRLDGMPVMVLGHQKGRDVKEKVYRNFGMPRPEGYRKAQRLMQMAERFNMPVLTFIDTPGAYPGIGAEERGQSEAIASSIAMMSRLKVPVLATVTGEGGSGGALAIGVCDHLTMLQYSTYSVISPEGCASILWKTADRASDAAQAMGITAKRLHELGLVDDILAEPLGGAHRNPAALMSSLKASLISQLERLQALDSDTLLAERYTRLMRYGAIG
ncbi:MAG: acetyl-CoA carboxylase carboxyltransferase subunit alpha [Litorivicinus sp.]